MLFLIPNILTYSHSSLDTQCPKDGFTVFLKEDIAFSVITLFGKYQIYKGANLVGSTGVYLTLAGPNERTNVSSVKKMFLNWLKLRTSSPCLVYMLVAFDIFTTYQKEQI